ncbi:unnamed protein product [Bursaphelenchus xylophilus]|uniref:(pine wood nematode) hypothetical protein n=1 Tax=Bursaphelenchus xylophilus TaxID=6326 RepID=A0A1I7S8E2_BURXY|nr:unnamed protein product [Bursaphelenchus xylophilus]CAG9121006.1 unnamed protein product [Bursaphelenchus xylophilus]
MVVNDYHMRLQHPEAYCQSTWLHNKLCVLRYLNPKIGVHPSWTLPGDLLLPKPPYYTPWATVVVCDVSLMDVIEESNKISQATHGSLFIIFDDYDTRRFLAKRAEQLVLPHTFVAPTNALDINLQIQQIYLFKVYTSRRRITTWNQLHIITMTVHRPARELYLSLRLKKPKRKPILYQGLSFEILEFNTEYSPTSGTLFMEFYVKLKSECRPDVVSNLALPYFGIGSSTELPIITMAVHRPTRELYRSLLLKKPKRRPILYQGMTLQGIMEDNMTSFGTQEFNAEYSPTAGTLFMEFYVKPRREFVSSTTTVQVIDNLRPMMSAVEKTNSLPRNDPPKNYGRQYDILRDPGVQRRMLADQDHGLRAVLNKFQKTDEEGKKIHFIPITSHILRPVYNYPVQPSLRKYQASPTSSSEQEQLELADEV